MYCKNCDREIESHSNGLPDGHPFQETCESYYGRLCPYCHHAIKLENKSLWQIEREQKKQLLAFELRKLMRKRLMKNFK